MNSHQELHAILTALREGKEREIKYFFGLLFPRLFFYSLRITRDKDISMIVVRESFTKLWENRMKVDNPKAWLYVVVRNESFGWLEEQKRDLARDEELRFVLGDDREDPVIKRIETAEVYGELYQSINQLSAEQQKIVRMVKIEGMSIKETAEVLGLAEQTVKNQLSRALKKLRENPPRRD